MAKKAKKYVGVMLTTDEYRALKSIADQDHRSLASALKLAAMDYVSKTLRDKAS